MVEVVSECEGLRTISVFTNLTDALDHARLLKYLYYGPSPEILGSNLDATILIQKRG